MSDHVSGAFGTRCVTCGADWDVQNDRCTSRDTEIERMDAAVPVVVGAIEPSTEVGRLWHAEWHGGEAFPGTPRECGTMGCGFLGRILALEQDAEGRSQPASEPSLDALYERVAAMLCAHAGDAEPHEATAEAIDANHGVTARTIVRIVRASRPADNEAAE